MKDSILVSGDMPPTSCPSCRRTLDGAAGIGGRMPKPGDGSLCSYCGAENVFDRLLNLRPMTKKERKKFARCPEYQIMREVAQIGARRHRAKLS